MLEKSVAENLNARKIPYEYEWTKLQYMQPAVRRSYTPDFRIGSIWIEVKGEFTVEDRKKHLWIQEQYPELDIRFVFGNPTNRISPKSKTTYAMWCEQHGFKYNRRVVPEAWIKEGLKNDAERNRPAVP